MHREIADHERAQAALVDPMLLTVEGGGEGHEARGHRRDLGGRQRWNQARPEPAEQRPRPDLLATRIAILVGGEQRIVARDYQFVRWLRQHAAER